MRSVRVRRRQLVDFRRVTLGDMIVLVASLFTLISLFMPWLETSIPRAHNEWAFSYSQLASVIVIVFFLTSLFLVLYPGLSQDLGLPALPFSTPIVFFAMGLWLLLMFTFELGRYGCIQCQGVSSRGFGVWVGLISALVYLIGAVIAWGSRSSRRR